jgi:hypothetical protein
MCEALTKDRECDYMLAGPTYRTFMAVLDKYSVYGKRISSDLKSLFLAKCRSKSIVPC